MEIVARCLNAMTLIGFDEQTIAEVERRSNEPASPYVSAETVLEELRQILPNRGGAKSKGDRE